MAVLPSNRFAISSIPAIYALISSEAQGLVSCVSTGRGASPQQVKVIIIRTIEIISYISNINSNNYKLICFYEKTKKQI